MNTRIRHATLSDFEQLNTISYELYHDHFVNRPDIFKDTSVCFKHESYKKDLEDEMIHLVVIEDLDKEEIVGYQYYEQIHQKETLLCNKRRFITIHDLVIKTGYRNQGYAKALHSYLINFCTEHDYTIIELDVWEFNQHAIKFYQSLGFTNKNRKMELFL